MVLLLLLKGSECFEEQKYQFHANFSAKKFHSSSSELLSIM